MQSIVLTGAAPSFSGFGAVTTVGTCPTSTAMGSKFTGDVLGIPWPMTLSSVAVGGGYYIAKPTSNQITIPKTKVPAMVASLIERNLAYYLPRVLADYPNLLTDPTQLLTIAKVRVGLYAGKAVFDKYKTFLGRDVGYPGVPKYAIMEAGSIRRFSILAPIGNVLPGKTCNGKAVIIDGIKRIVVAQDLGSSYGIGLYDPPDPSIIAQLLSPIAELAKFVGKVVNLAIDGIGAVISILKQALAIACQAAKGPITALTDQYIKKLASAEAKIASGEASTASGTVSTTGTATSDVTNYSNQAKAIIAKVCGTAPALTPQAETPPKSLTPYFLIGGGVLTAATLAAIGIRRRR